MCMLCVWRTDQSVVRNVSTKNITKKRIRQRWIDRVVKNAKEVDQTV